MVSRRLHGGLVFALVALLLVAAAGTLLADAQGSGAPERPSSVLTNAELAPLEPAVGAVTEKSEALDGQAGDEPTTGVPAAAPPGVEGAGDSSEAGVPQDQSGPVVVVAAPETAGAPVPPSADAIPASTEEELLPPGHRPHADHEPGAASDGGTVNVHGEPPGTWIDTVGPGEVIVIENGSEPQRTPSHGPVVMVLPGP